RSYRRSLFAPLRETASAFYGGSPLERARAEPLAGGRVCGPHDDACRGRHPNGRRQTRSFAEGLAPGALAPSTRPAGTRPDGRAVGHPKSRLTFGGNLCSGKSLLNQCITYLPNFIIYAIESPGHC